MTDHSFVIRVYGIFVDQKKGLFVSDELIKGKNITKFPGGGLEFGEGTIDCLNREMFEETGLRFNVLSHFYTTDYFVESVFDSKKQVISIYYMMEPLDELTMRISQEKFDFIYKQEGSQSFRFIPLDDVDGEQFTLSIDRKVGNLLKIIYNKDRHEKNHPT